MRKQIGLGSISTTGRGLYERHVSALRDGLSNWSEDECFSISAFVDR